MDNYMLARNAEEQMSDEDIEDEELFNTNFRPT
jgi:hypothetical protein